MGYDEESDVWTPYNSEGAAENLMRTLVASSAELSLEGRDAEAIFIARQFSEPNLAVEMIVPGPIPFRPGELLTVRFVCDGERYFFRCTPIFNGSLATLEIKDVFQLQRRRHYRVPIPEGFPSRIEVQVRRAGRSGLEGTVLNINAFGLGFELPQVEKFESDELVDADVQLGQRQVVKVAGHVRYVRESGGRTQVGLQFDHSVHHSQDAVQTILGFFRHDSFYFKKK